MVEDLTQIILSQKQEIASHHSKYDQLLQLVQQQNQVIQQFKSTISLQQQQAIDNSATINILQHHQSHLMQINNNYRNNLYEATPSIIIQEIKPIFSIALLKDNNTAFSHWTAFVDYPQFSSFFNSLGLSDTKRLNYIPSISFYLFILTI